MGTPSHTIAPWEVAGPVEARGATVGGVQIHSLRLPGYSVTTEIIFGQPEERLHFRHEPGSGAGPHELLVGQAVAASRLQGQDRLPGRPSRRAPESAARERI